MPYELCKRDVYSLAERLGIKHREKSDELFFEWCPYCGGAGKDKNTFSVNLENGAFKCFRASCGRQGHFVQLARDFGFRLEFEDYKSKSFKKLPQKTIPPSEKAVKLLAERGISPQITRKYQITVQKNDNSILVFPFYDETNTLQFVKYRNTKKFEGRKYAKEWCEEGTKPILFGMNHCVGFEKLIITEGQIDSLSLAEAGIKNAVSVPTGAKGFTWIEHCFDWVTKFKEIIVFGDNENGHITLADELSNRLPNIVKVVQSEDYYGEKDANDILRKLGKPALIAAVHNAAVEPVKQVKRLADVEAVDLNNMPKIKSNIYYLDKVIGGLYFGQVVLLTGKRGEGKSTFASQLCAEALEQGFPTFVYSGELPNYHFKRWLDFQIVGADYLRRYVNEYGDELYSIPENIIKRVNTWYRDLAYIYDSSVVLDKDTSEFETLTGTIEKSIMRYGIKFIMVDNLMTALDVEMSDDLYRAQSKFVKTLKQIAVKYNVCILLVAHPRKGRSDDANDDVAGSADITNRVDVVMRYSRSPEEANHDGQIEVFKNRLTGKLTKGPILLNYSRSSKRIIGFDKCQKRIYGWVKIPEQDFEEIIPEQEILPF